MKQIKVKGKMFSVSNNKNVTCNGKPISNEELERMLNDNLNK